MKETLEKLWSDYLLDECAVIKTDEERSLSKKASFLHDELDASLSDAQKDTCEKYIDALCSLDSLFATRAFFKGCEFATSFLLEVGIFKK